MGHTPGHIFSKVLLSHADTLPMVWVYLFVLLILLISISSVHSQSEVGQSHTLRLRNTQEPRPPAASPPTYDGVRPNARPEVSARYPNNGLATSGVSSVELVGNTYPLTYIDGCNRTHNIGFKFYLEAGLSCDFSARIHPHAVRFLNQNLHECAREGLEAIGETRSIARVDIHSQGVFVKRHIDNDPSKPWSNHSLGAAIDMNNLEIEFEDGSSETYAVAAVNFAGRLNPGFTRCNRNCEGRRYNRTGRALFYNGFYQCMRTKTDAIRAARRAEGVRCSGGVLGCDYDGDHANHIHLSVPICPSPRGVATI